MPIEIARAAASDHAAILVLHREAGWPGAHVDGDVWAARDGHDVVGTIQLLELAPGVVLIDAVVVRSDVRGHGIGAELVRAVLATREAHWWLECREERVAFYERLGFEVQPQAAVPALVRARVGTNETRSQFFLARQPLTALKVRERTK